MIQEIEITKEMIFLYVIIINIIGFFIMGIDKFKAQKGYWRTPEKTIFMITLLGGGIGTVAGMYVFRHKTKKLKFKLIYLVGILWVVLIIK